MYNLLLIFMKNEKSMFIKIFYEAYVTPEDLGSFLKSVMEFFANLRNNILKFDQFTHSVNWTI